MADRQRHLNSALLDLIFVRHPGELEYVYSEEAFQRYGQELILLLPRILGATHPTLQYGVHSSDHQVRMLISHAQMHLAPLSKRPNQAYDAWQIEIAGY